MPLPSPTLEKSSSKGAEGQCCGLRRDPVFYHTLLMRKTLNSECILLQRHSCRVVREVGCGVDLGFNHLQAM